MSDEDEKVRRLRAALAQAYAGGPAPSPAPMPGDEDTIRRIAESTTFRRALRPSEAASCDCRECGQQRRRIVRAVFTALAEAPEPEEPADHE